MKKTSFPIFYIGGLSAKIAQLAIQALLFMALVGCESETVAAEPEIRTTARVAEEVASNASDVLANKGPKWKVEYSGDLTGSIEGGILTSYSSPSSTIVKGVAMNKAMTGGAKIAVQAQIYPGGDELRIALVSLTLADGTKCQYDVTNMPMGRVLNADDNEFKAEISGELLCGEAKDKKISFVTTLNKQP